MRRTSVNTWSKTGQCAYFFLRIVAILFMCRYVARVLTMYLICYSIIFPFLNHNLRYSWYDDRKFSNSFIMFFFHGDCVGWFLDHVGTKDFGKFSCNFVASFLIVSKFTWEEYCPKSSVSRRVNTLWTYFGCAHVYLILSRCFMLIWILRRVRLLFLSRLIYRDILHVFVLILFIVVY